MIRSVFFFLVGIMLFVGIVRNIILEPNDFVTDPDLIAAAIMGVALGLTSLAVGVNYLRRAQGENPLFGTKTFLTLGALGFLPGPFMAITGNVMYSIENKVDDEIVTAGLQVCRQNSVAQATPYDENETGIHPIVIIQNGDSSGKDGYPSNWLPNSINELELVACLEQNDKFIERCPYDVTVRHSSGFTERRTFTISRHAKEMNVRIVAAKTGQVIDTFSITHEPGYCPPSLHSEPDNKAWRASDIPLNKVIKELRTWVNLDQSPEPTATTPTLESTATTPTLEPTATTPALVRLPPMTNPLFIIRQDGELGYIDATGTVIIEPQFYWSLDFSEEGLAAVQLNGVNDKWGYIDATGTVIIEPQFEDASSFSEGLAAVQLNDKWGYIDATGAIVIKPRFENARLFSEEGFAPVRLNGKWGYHKCKLKDLAVVSNQ